MLLVNLNTCGNPSDYEGEIRYKDSIITVIQYRDSVISVYDSVEVEVRKEVWDTMYHVIDSIKYNYVDSIVINTRDSINLINQLDTAVVDTFYLYNNQEVPVQLYWKQVVGDTPYSLDEWQQIVNDTATPIIDTLFIVPEAVAWYDNVKLSFDNNTIGYWADWYSDYPGTFDSGNLPVIQGDGEGEYEWKFGNGAVITLENESMMVSDRSKWTAMVRLGSTVGSGMLLQKGTQVSLSITPEGFIQTNIGPNSTCTWNSSPNPYDVVTIQQDVGYCKVYINGEPVSKRSGGSTENAGVDPVYWTVGGGNSTITDVVFLSTAVDSDIQKLFVNEWKKN